MTNPVNPFLEQKNAKKAEVEAGIDEVYARKAAGWQKIQEELAAARKLAAEARTYAARVEKERDGFKAYVSELEMKAAQHAVVEQHAKSVEEELSQLRRDYEETAKLYEAHSTQTEKKYGALELQLKTVKDKLDATELERDQLKEAFESALTDYDSLAQKVREALEDE